MEIPIFNKSGNQVNSIHISDTIEYIDGRVCKGEKNYYKGIGVPYSRHYIHPDDMNDEYEYIDRHSVFYMGNIVSKKCFKDKFGIFQERYQPHFTDWLGACGIKELNIFENLYDEGGFEMNSIEILDREVIDKDNEQYYLKVNYLDGRGNYLSNPQPKNLRILLDYMIQSDWNFPWDKNSITDISTKSKVSDVADIFKSKELKHKIGSIYSVLYSLYHSDKKEYHKFCDVNGLQHMNQMSFVFNTISLLVFNKVDISEITFKNPVESYKHIVLNYLIDGKNCGFCGVGSCKGRKDSNQSYGEEIRDEYVRMTRQQLKV